VLDRSRPVRARDSRNDSDDENADFRPRQNDEPGESPALSALDTEAMSEAQGLEVTAGTTSTGITRAPPGHEVMDDQPATTSATSDVLFG